MALRAAAGSSHGRVPRRSAASRHPSLLAVVPYFLFGSPAYDPALCAAALEFLEPGGSTGWSSLQANSTHKAMENSKPSFETRIADLKRTAETLREIGVSVASAAEVVMTEVPFHRA
jgi:hypothetical protein